ncbi:AAA family ATPase [Crossiella sp. CA-258035]|uniref:helix-turn-helix transcriptional regulator n=1 Tax=Crossiella sp. CA-258035 TaxID=2981138 RepID=UPI0024BCEB20|nr:LuxR family transcriptional regulator [Crossiella sp. CA-258035]WHT17579.1 AAA family ATPase [Crossiella sp. CA-258035]
MHGAVSEGIGRWLAELREGRARLVRFDGGPGTGRTTALRALTAAARQEHGCTAVLVRCAHAESGFAWGAVRQLLDALPPGEDLAGFAARDGGWFDALRGLAPGEIQQRLHWLLTRQAAQRPLVIAVDDAHWCDPESLRFLGYLARRLEHAPLLLAVGADPGATPEAERALAELTDDPDLLRVLLPALTADQVAAECRRVLGHDHLAAACLAATHGIPALVTAFLTAEPVGSAPRSVAAAALARASAHHPEAARALRVLSVLETPVPAPVAAKILDRPPAETADVLALLARLSCASVDAGGVAIGPPLLRQAVRQALAPSARHEAESRVVAVFAAEPGGRERAARHLLAVYPEGNTSHLELLHTSADQLLAQGRYTDAAQLLRRALAEPVVGDRRAELLAGLGTAELYQHTPSAAGHLETAMAESSSPASRLSWALQLAHALALTGKAAQARDILSAELDRVPLNGQQELLGRAAAELTFIALSSDDVLSARREETGGLGRRAARVEGMSGAYQVLSAAFECRPAAEVTARIHQALAGGLEPADQSAMTWLVVAGVLLWADQLDTAAQLFAKGATEADRWHAPLPRYTAAWLGGLTAWHAGRPDQARELTATAIRLAQGRDWDQWRVGPAIAALAIAEECPEAFPSPAACGLDEHGDLPRLWVADLALAARGQWKVGAGRPEAGLADLLAAGQRLTAIGCLNPAAAPWRSAAAVALSRLHREEEALALAEEEVRLARSWGAARALAVALRRSGDVRGGPDGLAEVEESVALLGERFPLELARGLLVKGRLLRSVREHEQAREVLGEAHRKAGQLGAGRLLARIRDELIAVGGRPRLPRPDQDGPLTTGERRVALLAARGATNEEIAARLYLARRTVEAHLTSVYRKLGISGRAQLPAGLGKLGLADGEDAAIPAG